MRVEILSIQEAVQAKGLAVVIDVFRAFSTACYIYANGAEDMISIDDVEIARELKKGNPGYILVGERDGNILPGFDFGNSPLQVKNADFSGRTIVFTTSLGTRGIAAAQSADIIITGSFVNASAVNRYIKKSGQEVVTLISTGMIERSILDEDTLCAQYIQDALMGRPDSFGQIYNNLKTSAFAAHFFDKTVISHPEEDFDLCLDLDRFSFILKSKEDEHGLIHLEKIEAS